MHLGYATGAVLQQDQGKGLAADRVHLEEDVGCGDSISRPRARVTRHHLRLTYMAALSPWE